MQTQTKSQKKQIKAKKSVQRLKRPWDKSYERITRVIQQEFDKYNYYDDEENLRGYKESIMCFVDYGL